MQQESGMPIRRAQPVLDVRAQDAYPTADAAELHAMAMESQLPIWTAYSAGG
jgi:hypothetical protein